MISCLNGRTAWRLSSNFKLTQNHYPKKNSVGNEDRNNVENRATTTARPIATPTTSTIRTRTEPGMYREPKIILKPSGESDKPREIFFFCEKLY